MTDEREKGEYEVWFPTPEQAEIQGKSVPIKELTWGELDKVARIIGELVSEIVAIYKGTKTEKSTTVGELMQAGVGGAITSLASVAPDRLAQIASIGTGIDVKVLEESKAAVVPEIVAAVITHNKGLKEAFFKAGRALIPKGQGKEAEAVPEVVEAEAVRPVGD